MKYLLVFFLLISLSFITGSKDPTIYLGHAGYTSGSMSTCVVRIIMATKKEEAKALFDKVFDSILLKDHGSLIVGSYIVWRPDSAGILKKQ